MTVPAPFDIHTYYKEGVKQTSGKVGGLDESQEKALKAVWAKLLAHFESTADKPIPVEKSMVKLSGLAKDGVSTGDSEAVAKWYADNKDKASNPKHQLVADKLYLDGNRELIVPSQFKPLFGDAADSRTFANAFWLATMRCHSPDAYVLNFLRACQWDVNKAFVRLQRSTNQRITQELDRLMWEGDLVQHLKVAEMGMCSQIGRDRFGSLVFAVPIRLNFPSARTEADIAKFTAYVLEKVAQLSRTCGEEAMIVYDFTGYKMENFELGFTKTIISTLQELYPLAFTGTLLYVNSWLFSGAWKVIRGWLDPVIGCRTQIVKDIESLEIFMDRDQIPISMGGQSKLEYKYVYPTKEGNAKMFDTEGRQAAEDEFAKAIAAFVQETKGWVDGSGPSSYNADSRAQAVSAFDKTAGNLEPYIRAQFLEERA
ncbi:phosphatidylinositol transfer protein csr1 [Coemansia erecta]|nr:phosphatidylinositol transfer protein csr1 [Coemansia erecta]